jgi:hypothetical protein
MRNLIFQLCAIVNMLAEGSSSWTLVFTQATVKKFGHLTTLAWGPKSTKNRSTCQIFIVHDSNI